MFKENFPHFKIKRNNENGERKRGDMAIKKIAEKNDDCDRRRRNLLIGSSFATLAIALKPLFDIWKKFEEFNRKADLPARGGDDSKKLNEEKLETKGIENHLEETINPLEKLDEEIYYDGDEPNVRAVREILDFHSEKKIKIDRNVVAELEKYWKDKYSDENKMKGDLVGALERMNPYLSRLRDIFRKYEVPEEYALLAIPESHFRPDAISPTGAEGPYQFMPETGEKYGLMTSEDRKDPLKSGDACARLLKDLYSSMGDWNMALAGYNGGFIWKYLKLCRKNKTQPNYDNFLYFLTFLANKAKKEIKTGEIFPYKVKKNDSLSKIAKKTGTDVKDLIEFNKLKSNSLKEGQSLRIPLKEGNRKVIYGNLVRGISENINYPPKYNAVWQLIKNTSVWRDGDLKKYAEN